jgi:hypothetical protein
MSLLIAALAVWRISSLLSEEYGPYDIFERLRTKTAGTQLGKALKCFYCISVWVALPFTYLFASNALDVMTFTLALSALAILFQGIVNKLEE